MTWKSLKAVEFLVVHCSATRPSQDIGLAEIRKWHLQKGWLDVGYHYVIRRDGTVEKGRPDTQPGAHVRGYNHVSLGICLVGGVAADGKTAEANFMLEQYRSLRRLVQELKTTHPGAIVLGHRDFPDVRKACPSFEVAEWWANEESKT